MVKKICDCNNIDIIKVADAKKTMLNKKDLLRISLVLKILSNLTRLKIVWALKDNELCVCDLAAILDMTKSAISHQLQTMKAFHVVKSRRSGKNIFYSLDDEHIMEIVKTAEIHVNH